MYSSNTFNSSSKGLELRCREEGAARWHAWRLRTVAYIATLLLLLGGTGVAGTSTGLSKWAGTYVAEGCRPSDDCCCPKLQGQVSVSANQSALSCTFLVAGAYEPSSGDKALFRASQDANSILQVGVDSQRSNSGQVSPESTETGMDKSRLSGSVLSDASCPATFRWDGTFSCAQNFDLKSHPGQVTVTLTSDTVYWTRVVPHGHPECQGYFKRHKGVGIDTNAVVIVCSEMSSASPSTQRNTQLTMAFDAAVAAGLIACGVTAVCVVKRRKSRPTRLIPSNRLRQNRRSGGYLPPGRKTHREELHDMSASEAEDVSGSGDPGSAADGGAATQDADQTVGLLAGRT